MAKSPSRQTRKKPARSSSKSIPRKRTTTSKSRSTAKRSATKTTRKPASKTSQRLKWTGLSRERKLDLIGVLGALIGFLSLLSLFTRSGAVSIWWSTMLIQTAGWGAYLIPLSFILIGAWLLFSHLEKLPVLTIDRLIGFILLFFNLLTWLSVVSAQAAKIGDAQVGGGMLGAFFQRLIVNGLGFGAAIVVLIAWLLIAITLTLDITLADLFRMALPLFKKMSDQLQRELRERRAERMNKTELKLIPPEPIEDLPESYQPIENLAEKKPSKEGKQKSQAEITEKEKIKGQGPEAVPQIVHSRPRSDWKLPKPKDILDAATPTALQDSVDMEIARLIEDTLASFGAPGHVVDIKRGPTITQYGIEPDFLETRYGRTRVRVSKITSLADDLALALAAPRIRIQAPVPGKSFVGIEVPNPETSRVTLIEVIESAPFKRIRSPIRFALGKDVSGKSIAVDLSRLPHLLIAGTTGSGKSVCVNSILSSLLLHNTPSELRLVLVDPKRVELTGYNGIPHLLSPVVTEAESVINALQWMTREMDSRYHKFSKAGVRNIEEHNAHNPSNHLPYLVVVIDELADLMMLAPDETERAITRLAQLARATGIHLVLATQRPSTDVVTGLIKANFPARIAFAVASGVDSRVILDQPGAERLLGRGDMLFQAPDASAPVRLQGVFVSEGETRRLVDYWRTEAGRHVDAGVEATQRVGEDIPRGVPLQQTPLWEEEVDDNDPLYSEAIDLIRRQGRASITMLQRRLRIGYTRAARLIDQMEEEGIISEKLPNTQAREVLDFGEAAPPADED